MSETTGIEWADHTASPWYGCAHAIMQDGTEHPGCLNCYAERMAKRNPVILGQWGPGGTRVVSKSFADNCRRWNKAAERDGVRRRVFPSMCDPFEDGHAIVLDQAGFAIVPSGELQRIGQRQLTRQMLELADECPWLDFVLLTKRPQKVRTNWTEWAWSACATGDCLHETQDECDADKSRRYRDNAWLLASVSDQPTAQEMVQHLLKCRDLAPVLGLSIDPLLGPINLRTGVYEQHDRRCRGTTLDGIDWVIVGGESGPNARPCNIAWIRSIVAQCRAVEVPCFVRQLGSRPYDDGCQPAGGWWPDQKSYYDDRVNGQHARFRRLRDSKGGDPSEWPEDLRVREFPIVKGGE